MNFKKDLKALTELVSVREVMYSPLLCFINHFSYTD